jgi:hypothetical protein
VSRRRLRVRVPSLPCEKTLQLERFSLWRPLQLHRERFDRLGKVADWLVASPDGEQSRKRSAREGILDPVAGLVCDGVHHEQIPVRPELGLCQNTVERSSGSVLVSEVAHHVDDHKHLVVLKKRPGVTVDTGLDYHPCIGQHLQERVQDRFFIRLGGPARTRRTTWMSGRMTNALNTSSSHPLRLSEYS